MTIEATEVRIRGVPLHRLILKPKSPLKGGLLFFHGQGDFIDRYPPILELFVKAGFQCLLTDLPGHGRSPGKRGHVPGLDFVDALCDQSLEHLKDPLVIAGHSMGGLMALRLFLLQPERFHAMWVSSPLLGILDRKSPLLAKLLPLLAKLLPKLTIGTGVTSYQCGDYGGQPRREPPETAALYHSRISLSWGLELHQACQYVWREIRKTPPRTPLLVTQGEEDVICPPDVLENLLEKTSVQEAHLELIPGARHEPFSGASREEFLERLHHWIEKTLS
jgi:alpha-beta hydrolase superfamily lysophospholipase